MKRVHESLQALPEVRRLNWADENHLPARTGDEMAVHLIAQSDPSSCIKQQEHLNLIVDAFTGSRILHHFLAAKRQQRPRCRPFALGGDETSPEEDARRCLTLRSQPVASARFVSAIRDRLACYATQDYPDQLALAARLAAPPPDRQAPGDRPKTPKAPRDTHRPRYIPMGGVKVACNLPFIATEIELDQWLSELRKAIASELAKGNHVSP